MSTRNYQTRECSIGELQPGLAKAMKQYISGDDKVLVCLETKVEKKPGLRSRKEFEFYASAVTQNRVIEVTRQDIGSEHLESASSMRLIDIVSIQESQAKMSEGKSGIAYYIEIIGPPGSKIGCTFSSRQAAREFADTLRQAIEQAKSELSATPTMSPASVEERLRVLTQLHREGLIDESEFQQKRKEILRQL